MNIFKLPPTTSPPEEIDSANTTLITTPSNAAAVKTIADEANQPKTPSSESGFYLHKLKRKVSLNIAIPSTASRAPEYSNLPSGNLLICDFQQQQQQQMDSKDKDKETNSSTPQSRVPSRRGSGVLERLTMISAKSTSHQQGSKRNSLLATIVEQRPSGVGQSDAELDEGAFLSESPRSQPERVTEGKTPLRKQSMNIFSAASFTGLLPASEYVNPGILDMSSSSNHNNHSEPTVIQVNQNRLPISQLRRVKVLGHGSSGLVELAIHDGTGILVGIKSIPLLMNSSFRKQLDQELKTLISCDSPGIVKCYGAYIQKCMINITLEYMDIGTVHDLVKRLGPLPEPIVASIGIQIVRGLEYIHKQVKVIHRDIKPSNLLVNSAGEVKIGDFGVSANLESAVEAKNWVGTVTYMSPERFRGQAYSANTDIWSLGLSMCEAALGVYPFFDTSQYEKKENLSFWEFLEYFNIKAAPRLPDNFSDETKDFVAKCFKKSPLERPSSSDLLDHPMIKKHDTEETKRFFAQWIQANNLKQEVPVADESLVNTLPAVITTSKEVQAKRESQQLPGSSASHYSVSSVSSSTSSLYKSPPPSTGGLSSKPQNHYLQLQSIGLSTSVAVTAINTTNKLTSNNGSNGTLAIGNSSSRNHSSSANHDMKSIATVNAAITTTTSGSSDNNSVDHATAPSDEPIPRSDSLIKGISFSDLYKPPLQFIQQNNHSNNKGNHAHHSAALQGKPKRNSEQLKIPQVKSNAAFASRLSLQHTGLLSQNQQIKSEGQSPHEDESKQIATRIEAVSNDHKSSISSGQAQFDQLLQESQQFEEPSASSCTSMSNVSFIDENPISRACKLQENMRDQLISAWNYHSTGQGGESRSGQSQSIRSYQQQSQQIHLLQIPQQQQLQSQVPQNTHQSSNNTSGGIIQSNEVIDELNVRIEHEAAAARDSLQRQEQPKKIMDAILTSVALKVKQRILEQLPSIVKKEFDHQMQSALAIITGSFTNNNNNVAATGHSVNPQSGEITQQMQQFQQPLQQQQRQQQQYVHQDQRYSIPSIQVESNKSNRAATVAPPTPVSRFQLFDQSERKVLMLQQQQQQQPYQHSQQQQQQYQQQHSNLSQTGSGGDISDVRESISTSISPDHRSVDGPSFNTRDFHLQLNTHGDSQIELMRNQSDVLKYYGEIQQRTTVVNKPMQQHQPVVEEAEPIQQYVHQASDLELSKAIQKQLEVSKTATTTPQHQNHLKKHASASLDSPITVSKRPASSGQVAKSKGYFSTSSGFTSAEGSGGGGGGGQQREGVTENDQKKV